MPQVESAGASVLLALIVAALATMRMSPRYSSSITLVVSVRDDGGTGSAYQAVLRATSGAANG